MLLTVLNVQLQGLLKIYCLQLHILFLDYSRSSNYKIDSLESKLKKYSQNLSQKMGIRCIRSEQTSEKDPVFLYQNMVHSIKDIPVTKNYDFLDKIGILYNNLGKGSYSQVYKARSIKSGKQLAIKKIFRKSQRQEQTLLNEFSILKQLDHPNILKMYQMYEEQGYIYITTQLCAGKELFDVIIKEKCFKEIKAKQIFYQIVSAVKYLHGNYVMHRDLKPQNIIYDPDTKNLKIVDFGSAIRFQTSQLQSRKRIGTSYYIAPEVLKKFYNQKCDIWSLGIILFILLSGQPPFKGKQDEQILANVMNMPLQFKKPIWMVVSDLAKDLIRKMLTRNPIERLSAVDLIKHPWFANTVKPNETNYNHQQVEQSLHQVLQNMKKFKDMKSSSIQEGMLIFIVNFVQNNKQEAELMKCFKTLDLNSDGVLSLQQLTQGLLKYLKLKEKQAHSIAQKIFNKVDSNNSGFIDYSQFLVAATNLQIAVSEQNLQTAFNYMDDDGNGKLSIQEIRKRLGQNVSEEKYQKLLKNYDKNKDGYISKSEFIQMMRSLLKM